MKQRNPPKCLLNSSLDSPPDKFIKNFEKKVKKTIEYYQLCSPKDKIMVAISGGKDSTTTLYLLKKLGYSVEALHLNLLIGKWSQRNLEKVKQFCQENQIKLQNINLREELGASLCFFRSHIQTKVKVSNCLICGLVKKGLLNKKARELKATKLATGHNLDDEVETFLMNLIKNKLSLSLTAGPLSNKLSSKKFVPRFKPLYFCSSQEVKRYSQIKKFPVIYEPCPCSSNSFRRKIRELLNKEEIKNPKVKQRIIKVLLELLPILRKKYLRKKKEKINSCLFCGEPSRKKVCKLCQLIQKVQEEKTEKK